MYEKEINLILIDVSFIFLKSLLGNVFYGVPKYSKQITVGNKGGGFPCPWLYDPGFLDYWAVGPRVKNSKMITVLFTKCK